jgi:hypothetical protein
MAGQAIGRRQARRARAEHHDPAFHRTSPHISVAMPPAKPQRIYMDTDAGYRHCGTALRQSPGIVLHEDQIDGFGNHHKAYTDTRMLITLAP